MKFSVSNQDLVKALSTVSRAISSKSTMPILECIYMQAENNNLFLKGSDGELSITSKIPTIVTMEGECVVPIKTLIELVRTYPDEMIDFHVDERNVIHISCAKSDSASNVMISGRNANEYPNIKTYPSEHVIHIEHQTLKDMIKDTVFACAYQESISPVLTGVLIEYNANMLRFVALDGFKLALRNETITSDQDQRINCIVPGKTLAEILKILSIYQYDTYIQIIDNKFVVNIGDTQIVSNILEGNFINYESLIPTEINTVVKLNTAELLNSVSRAALITDETKNSLIKMDFIGEQLEITSESEIGNVTEKVNISKNGDDLKIAFNSKFFVEVLKIIDDERIVIEFKDKLKPALIKPVNNDSFMYLIMPVRYID